MTNKMTNKKALTYVLEYMTDIPADVREKLEAMLAALENKSSTTRKPTKTQLENEGYKQAILEFMENDPLRMMTCTELGKEVPELDSFNSQKISALMRGLVNDGVVTKVVEKGKSYFQLVVDEKEDGE